MKYFFFLTVLITSLFASAQDQFSINGKLEGADYSGKTIYLKYINDSYDYVDIDSSKIENGNFFLKGNVQDTPRLGFVLFKERNLPGAMIILEPGNISLTMTQPYTVKGTPKNDEFQQFYNEQNKMVEKIYSLPPKTGENSKEYQELYGQLKKSSADYLRKNIKNKVGEYLLLDLSGSLDKETVLELLAETRTDFSKSKLARQLHQSLNSRQPSIGDNYLDVKLYNEEGKEVSLSDYIGKSKYVLVDFWASWCAPCHREMPTFIKAYNLYKDKGLEIVGISLDEDSYAWKRTIKRLQMVWPQMSDLGGWNSKAAQVYSVTTIPFTLLLDEKGKVVAKNLRGEALLNKLEEILN